MTEVTITTLVVALLAAAPPTLAALATLQQGRKVAQKTEAIGQKADEIHALADGNLTRVSNGLDTANTEIRAQRQQITDLQALVQALVAPAAPPLTSSGQ